MSSSTTTTSNNNTPSQSKWLHLPSDILTTIATLLDSNLGHLRLRSVCHPWRSSLPTATSTSSTIPSFPLFLPSPLPTTTTHSPLFIRRQILYLLTSPNHPTFLLNLEKIPIDNNNNSTLFTDQTPNDNLTLFAELTLNGNNNNNNNHNNNNNNSFTVVTKETPIDKNNNFTLCTPLSTRPSEIPDKTLNLLNFGVRFISISYTMKTNEVFKKVVVGNNGKGVIVVGVTVDERLLVWKYGDENWTTIDHNVRSFDDIVVHDGKFYATTDRKGRLVVIDFHENRVVNVVKCLMYGSGYNTTLVGCELGLFLVDIISERWKEYQIDVYKLDEKGRFWDYEFDLNDGMFFLGDNCVNLWLSRKDYDGGIGNVIYCIGDEGVVKVWDMKKRIMCPVVDNEACRELFSPPLDCFDGFSK